MNYELINYLGFSCLIVIKIILRYNKNRKENLHVLGVKYTDMAVIGS